MFHGNSEPDDHAFARLQQLLEHNRVLELVIWVPSAEISIFVVAHNQAELGDVHVNIVSLVAAITIRVRLSGIYRCGPVSSIFRCSDVYRLYEMILWLCHMIIAEKKFLVL